MTIRKMTFEDFIEKAVGYEAVEAMLDNIKKNSPQDIAVRKLDLDPEKINKDSFYDVYNNLCFYEAMYKNKYDKKQAYLKQENCFKYVTRKTKKEFICRWYKGWTIIDEKEIEFRTGTVIDLANSQITDDNYGNYIANTCREADALAEKMVKEGKYQIINYNGQAILMFQVDYKPTKDGGLGEPIFKPIMIDSPYINNSGCRKKDFEYVTKGAFTLWIEDDIACSVDNVYHEYMPVLVRGKDGTEKKVSVMVKCFDKTLDRETVRQIKLEEIEDLLPLFHKVIEKGDKYFLDIEIARDDTCEKGFRIDNPKVSRPNKYAQSLGNYDNRSLTKKTKEVSYSFVKELIKLLRSIQEVAKCDITGENRYKSVPSEDEEQGCPINLNDYLGLLTLSEKKTIKQIKEVNDFNEKLKQSGFCLDLENYYSPNLNDFLTSFYEERMDKLLREYLGGSDDSRDLLMSKIAMAEHLPKYLKEKWLVLIDKVVKKEKPTFDLDEIDLALEILNRHFGKKFKNKSLYRSEIVGLSSGLFGASSGTIFSSHYDKELLQRICLAIELFDMRTYMDNAFFDKKDGYKEGQKELYKKMSKLIGVLMNDLLDSYVLNPQGVEKVILDSVKDLLEKEYQKVTAFQERSQPKDRYMWDEYKCKDKEDQFPSLYDLKNPSSQDIEILMHQRYTGYDTTSVTAKISRVMLDAFFEGKVEANIDSNPRNFRDEDDILFRKTDIVKFWKGFKENNIFNLSAEQISDLDKAFGAIMEGDDTQSKRDDILAVKDFMKIATKQRLVNLSIYKYAGKYANLLDFDENVPTNNVGGKLLQMKSNQIEYFRDLSIFLNAGMYNDLFRVMKKYNTQILNDADDLLDLRKRGEKGKDWLNGEITCVTKYFHEFSDEDKRAITDLKDKYQQEENNISNQDRQKLITILRKNKVFTKVYEELKQTQKDAISDLKYIHESFSGLKSHEKKHYLMMHKALKVFIDNKIISHYAIEADIEKNLHGEWKAANDNLKGQDEPSHQGTIYGEVGKVFKEGGLCI